MLQISTALIKKSGKFAGFPDITEEILTFLIKEQRFIVAIIFCRTIVPDKTCTILIGIQLCDKDDHFLALSKSTFHKSKSILKISSRCLNELFSLFCILGKRCLNKGKGFIRIQTIILDQLLTILL